MISGIARLARTVVVRILDILRMRKHVRELRARFSGRPVIDLQNPPEEIFRSIYATNYWGSDESRSGTGSTLGATNALRSELHRLFSELGVRAIVDAACGDFAWMREMHFEKSEIDYLGVDIVPELIAANNKKYGKANIHFEVRNLIHDRLPSADLVICRDCLVHLSNEHVLQAVQNIAASGSRYFLTTSFQLTRKNKDISTGDWRPLNLLLPPFSLGAPSSTFPEKGVEDGFEGSKTLLLLDLNDLREIFANRPQRSLTE